MGEFKDKMKGKAKQLEGRVTGDPVRSAEGMMQEAVGNVKGAFNKAGEATKKIAESAKESIKNEKRK
jgi:uncharacterized protein YjbJ (UPF0337 family)